MKTFLILAPRHTLKTSVQQGARARVETLDVTSVADPGGVVPVLGTTVLKMKEPS